MSRKRQVKKSIFIFLYFCIFVFLYNYSSFFSPTENLMENAKQFQKNTNELKKVMWWKNMKLWLAIIAIIVVIIIVIVVICVLVVK